jgi:hypothetical protein
LGLIEIFGNFANIFIFSFLRPKNTIFLNFKISPKNISKFYFKESRMRESYDLLKDDSSMGESFRKSNQNINFRQSELSGSLEDLRGKYIS